MAARGRSDWRGGGRGRGRSRGRASIFPNSTTYGQSAAARSYGIGRGSVQVEANNMCRSATKTQSIVTENEIKSEALPVAEMGSLNIQQVHGSEVLVDVVPGLTQHTHWIQQLTSAWTQGHQSQALSQLLVNIFLNTSNPYKTALYLIYKSPGFNTNKGNSLSMVIIKEFDKWLKRSGTVSPVGDELKNCAFDIALQQKNSELIKLILNTYQVVDEPQLFLDHVKFFVLRRRFREAAICATVLKLQHFFDIREIIVPLMLQDSLCFVEDYLADCKEQQRTFLAFVDSLCVPRDSQIQRMLMDMSDVPDIKHSKCLPKIFRKLCTRLMKKFDVPSETCPNVAQGKSTGAVKYLFYKKYVEKSVDFEDWDELVHDAVRDDVASQKELIMNLTCFNDIPCAVKYARKYSIPANELPPVVQKALRDNVIRTYEPLCQENSPRLAGASAPAVSTVQSESWDDDESDVGTSLDYHQLSLPKSSILFVDSKIEFLSLIDYLCKSCRVVGIDGEWKPSFGLTPTKLAVLQLATEDKIYMLDTITLLDVLTEDEWLLFVKSLFCNWNIVKLGFGISSDFNMMGKILPEAAATAMTKRVNVVDLQNLSSVLCKSSPEIFPYDMGEGGNGLTDLTKACLGKSLNKADQFSNWERRPLRESQLLYAALDAFCLLEIYHILRRRALELDIDLDTMIKSCTTSKSKTPRGPNKQKQTGVRASPLDRISVPPEIPCCPGELAVVVDTMLQGLGRRLRLCGVDVKILETTDDHDEAVKIAMREKRVILTSGAPYTKLRQYVPEGKCLNVKPGTTKEQVAQVFEAFSVQMTTKDIFSRCQNCNNSRYIKVPQKSMKSLWEKDCTKPLSEKPSSDLLLGCHTNITEYNSSFQEYEGGKIDINCLKTDTGAKLRFDGVIPPLFDRVDQFYVCANCGKVYWIGSHMSRALEAFGDMVINDTD